MRFGSSTGAKASLTTEAEIVFMAAVVLQHRNLSHRRQVKAKRAVAHWKARGLLLLGKEVSRREDVNWRRVYRSTEAVYSAQI